MPVVAESGVLTKPALLARDVLRYHQAEALTGILIYFMLVFSPWAFGTTQSWSIWVMRGCAYALGLMLWAKIVIRRRKAYRPRRWDQRSQEEQLQKSATWQPKVSLGLQGRKPRKAVWVPSRSGLVSLLAVLTICLLVYCLVAALNARGACNPVWGTFEYYNYVSWLPHSFDRPSTVEAFWTTLALACTFWAIVDWLPGKEPKEMRPQSAAVGQGTPVRLRRLLWVVSLSGGLLALEGVVQRVSNSPKLLFLVQPEILQTADTHLASYAYRSNGAQYFNLLWPVCAAWWWARQRSACGGPIREPLLLGCAAIMAACPLLCGARGPGLIDLGMLSVAASVWAVSILTNRVLPRKAKWQLFIRLAGVLGGILLFGLALGWRDLRPRLERFGVELGQREALYESARRMVRDYPLFGTGPGTFERVFQVYRASADSYWPAQLHDDWLEIRITFGWLGAGLLGLALVVICAGWFVPEGLRGDRRLAFGLGLALAGCLVEARWDFPLQVYSILFLFLVWCAMLFCFSCR